MNDSPDPEPKDARAAAPPRIRSFVVRAGRMGPGQARALATLAPRFVFPSPPRRSTSRRVRPRRAARGRDRLRHGQRDRGDRGAPRRMSTSSASRSTRPASARCCSASTSSGSTNVRIVQHDAVEVLESMVAPASLAGVHVFFPDPWHKKRHHKRRLVQRRSCACSRAGSRPARRCTARPTGSPTPSRCWPCCRRRADARQRRRRRLRAAAAVAAADQVRAARARPRPRRARPRVPERARRGSRAAPARPSSVLPDDDAAPRGREDDQAERDPVPGERHEGVRRRRSAAASERTATRRGTRTRRPTANSGRSAAESSARSFHRL